MVCDTSSMFVIFYFRTCKLGRPPFDLQTEAELVAGYQTEYSGMMYTMFGWRMWKYPFNVCYGLNTVSWRLTANNGYLPIYHSAPYMDDF